MRLESWQLDLAAALHGADNNSVAWGVGEWVRGGCNLTPEHVPYVDEHRALRRLALTCGHGW